MRSVTNYKSHETSRHCKIGLGLGARDKARARDKTKGWGEG